MGPFLVKKFKYKKKYILDIGLSIKGLTPLIAFKGKMCSGDFILHTKIIKNHKNCLLKIEFFEFFVALRNVT
jgi:hypothetical protein